MVCKERLLGQYRVSPCSPRGVSALCKERLVDASKRLKRLKRLFSFLQFAHFLGKKIKASRTLYIIYKIINIY